MPQLSLCLPWQKQASAAASFRIYISFRGSGSGFFSTAFDAGTVQAAASTRASVLRVCSHCGHPCQSVLACHLVQDSMDAASVGVPAATCAIPQDRHSEPDCGGCTGTGSHSACTDE